MMLEQEIVNSLPITVDGSRIIAEAGFANLHLQLIAAYMQQMVVELKQAGA